MSSALTPSPSPAFPPRWLQPQHRPPWRQSNHLSFFDSPAATYSSAPSDSISSARRYSISHPASITAPPVPREQQLLLHRPCWRVSNEPALEAKPTQHPATHTPEEEEDGFTNSLSTTCISPPAPLHNPFAKKSREEEHRQSDGFTHTLPDSRTANGFAGRRKVSKRWMGREKKGCSSGEDGGMGRKQKKEEYKCCGWDRTSDLRDQISLVPGVFPLYHTAFTCLFIVHLVLGGKLGLSLGAVVGCVVFAVVSHLAKRFGVTRPHARCAVGWLCGMAVAMRGSKAVCRRGGKVYTLEDVILKGVVAMMMAFWLLRWVISGVSAALPCQRQYP